MIRHVYRWGGLLALRVLVKVGTDPGIGPQRGARLRVGLHSGLGIAPHPDSVCPCRLIGTGAPGVLRPGYRANKGVGLGEGPRSELHLLRCSRIVKILGQRHAIIIRLLCGYSLIGLGVR